MKMDFHIHTINSDGEESVKIIIEKAKEIGINILSITDHDTLNGVREAINIGEKNNIRIIPGIELTTSFNNESIHVLGYFKNINSTLNIEEKLKELKQNRENRLKRMIENLKNYYNIEISFGEILKNAKGTVGRPHISRAIQNKGYGYEWQYIFDKILSKDGPVYVPNKKINTKDGIDLLKKSGAIVILAHPVLIKKTPIEKFMELGFDGMESYYSENKIEDTNKYVRIAKENNMLITCGSDFHRVNDSRHGYIGSVKYIKSDIEEFIKKFNV